jgi:spermidine/putrescine transport system permease protein
MNTHRRQAWSIFGLTAPAYIWLAITVLLPLTAMLYFSFLTAAPIGGKEATFTLRHYVGFFTKSIYWYNAWRSIELGLYVTGTCLILAYPAALGLAKVVKGRWREAIFLLIILPFWSNALVRTFSWTMVLRQPLDILYSYPAIVIGLVHAYLPYAILTIYVSFRRIILPLSMPGVLAGVFLIFVPVIGSFMEPRILGGKQAIMLGPIIESQFTALNNWSLGAALSFIMLAIVLIILGISTPVIKPYLERSA